MEVRSAALRQVSFRAIGWLAVVAMLAAAVLGPSAPRVLAAPGAIYTSNSDGTIVNANIYAAKGDVYLTGGPCGETGHLDAGDYYFQVSAPSGELLSSDAIGDRLFTVNADGYISSTTAHVTADVACFAGEGITVQLLPYDDTPNPGGEYKLTIAEAESVEACEGFDAESTSFEICQGAEQKSDNFKVGEEEPSAPPSAPPSEPPVPNEALVFVWKFLDIDGDPETDDVVPGEGWSFVFDVGDGEIVAEENPTDEDGFAGFLVEFEGDTLGVAVTEVLQADFELMDAWCIESELAEPEGLSQRPTRSVQAVGDEIPTTLDGLELSFDVAADSVTECFFINTSGGVEEATGTPVITAGPTLPPTDLEGSAAPLSDTWRMALIALAGILASVLVMTPARSTRRR